MKFLVDNALPPEVARALRVYLSSRCHDAVHVRDYGKQDAPDSEVFMIAEAEDRVIVSADSDFGMLLALRRQEKPSFILMREPELIRPAEYAELILRCLPTLESGLAAGCVVTFRRGMIRLRKLPFRP